MTNTKALLVQYEVEPFEGLTQRLGELGISWLLLRTLVETKYYLKRRPEPAMIFTAVSLPDGTWADMVELGRGATPPCPVIVVSRVDNLDLYLEALKKGAMDFIVTPFAGDAVELAVRAARKQLAGEPQAVAAERAAGA
jgi:DNA-binding NtrC family response regulator